MKMKLEQRTLPGVFASRGERGGKGDDSAHCSSFASYYFNVRAKDVMDCLFGVLFMAGLEDGIAEGKNCRTGEWHANLNMWILLAYRGSTFLKFELFMSEVT